jgi:hypothetical protein
VEAYRRSGCTIIEAVVPPHGALELLRRVQSRVNLELEVAMRSPVGASRRDL